MHFLALGPEQKQPSHTNQNDLLSASKNYIEALSLAQETKHNAAIQCFKEAMVTYQKYDSLHLYLDCVNHVSMHFRALYQYDSTKRYAVMAMSALRQMSTPDTTRIFTTHKNLGDYYYTFDQYDSAIYFYELSLEMVKLHPFLGFLPDLYNNLGGVYYDQGQYSLATSYVDQAISLSKGSHNQSRITLSHSYSNKALILVDTEDYEAALHYFNKALLIQTELLGACHPTTADTYGEIGLVYQWQWKFEQALSYHFRALEVFKEVYTEENLYVIESYDLIAGAYSSLDEFDKAKIYFDKALTLAHKVLGKAHPVTSNLYMSIGVNYGNSGHEEIALEYFVKELDMSNRFNGEHHPNTAYSHLNLGAYWSDRGDSSKALQHFRKALTIRKSILGKTSNQVAEVLSNIGILYEELLQYDSAIHYHTKANKIYETLTNEPFPELAISYNSLSLIQEGLGDYDSARRLTQKALAMQLELFGPRHSHVTYSYNRLGNLAFSMNQPKESLDLYNKAMEANVKKHSSGKPTKNLTAADFYDDGYAVETYQGFAQVFETLYKTDQDISQLEKALTVLLKGEKLVDARRQHLNRIADRVYNSKFDTHFYNQSVRVCHELYKQTKDRAFLKRAYHFSQKNKANALSDLIAELSAKNASQIPQSLRELEDSLRNSLSNLQTKIDVLEGSPSDSLYTFYLDRIFDQKRKHDSLILFLEKTYPKYHALKYRNHLLDLDSIKGYLKHNEAVIEYFVGQESIFLFLLTAKNERLYQFPKPQSFEQTIIEFRGVLSKNPLTYENDSSHQQLLSYASEIYKRYLQEALQTLDSTTSTLILIPDGVLGQLPFDMLVTSSPENSAITIGTEKYLHEFYQISYAHSASLRFGRFIQRKTSNKKILAFAPSYTYENVNVPITPVRKTMDLLSPLMWNIKEVKSIIESNGGLALTGQDAQESTFKKISKDYQVLHIAAHAITNDLNPMKSGLAFDHPSDSTQDGFLHAYEVYGMNISADLTVLSACQTAYGKLAKGEGVMSIARAFSASGCPSLLVSHWPVDDKVTAEIMIHFYGYLSQGLRKDKALRLAKNKFLENTTPVYQHPYFWSSFVLIGNTDPILLESDSRENVSYLIVILSILCISSIFWRAFQTKR